MTPRATPPLRVLLIDDNPAYRAVAGEWLREAGHEVEVEESGTGALARIEDESYDVILLDLAMPGVSGLEFIQRLDTRRHPEVVVVSGTITVRSAVEAMKLGAFDCVPKTDRFEALDIVVRKAAEAYRRKREVELLTRCVEHQTSPGPEFITRSPRVRALLEVLRDVAASNVSVLLTGESGTGKDLLARQVHRLSGRAAGPFVDINCAALPESLLEAELFGYEKGAFTGAAAMTRGLAEAADGGTLFLDEVAEMPPNLQAKLLRMTEDRTLYRVGGRQRIRLDVRIVAATNRDLKREIAAGRMRDDLYFRLAGVEIEVPPLRERTEDVEPLAEHYLRLALRQQGRGPTSIAPAAMVALSQYRWPGNVRELRNVMERMALLVKSSVLEWTHLPTELQAAPGSMPAGGNGHGPSGGLPLKEIERGQILRVLEEEGWHQARSAARLGLPLRTLYRKIKAFNLMRPGAGGEPQ